MPSPPSRLPRGFIGSSNEGRLIAEYLQAGLRSCAECTVWSQGVFGLSGSTLETLCTAVTSYDFAAFVLTPDDLVRRRDEVAMRPRDNVLFELGLFMGALGRGATFIVQDEREALDLPTDLAGVTTARWSTRTDGNWRAALTPVCLEIREALESRAAARQASSPSEIDTLREALLAQSRDFRLLVETVNRGLSLPQPATSGNDPAGQVGFLEGTWVNHESGSHAYARIVGGVLRFPYCYSDNDWLTGEYYAWVRAGDVLTAQFRWLDGSRISGYTYLQIRSTNELVGGWWYGTDVSAEELKKLPHVRGMQPITWVRTKPGALPEWVTAYYDSLRETPSR